MSSIELRRQWDDFMKQGRLEDALQTAIDIIGAEAGSDNTAQLLAYRPLVMTLEKVARLHPDFSHETLGFAEHRCKQMLELVPDDQWTLNHLREIRRKLRKGKLYEDRCWKCHAGISSLLCPQCERCKYYKCRNCGACFCGFSS